MDKDQLNAQLAFLAALAKKAEAPFEDHVKAQMAAQTLSKYINSSHLVDAAHGEEAREAAE